MRKHHSLRLLALIIVILAAAYPVFAATVTIDNFESSDISTWSVFYTQISRTTDGAGSTGALQIQEGGAGTTAHTPSALARKAFASPQDWSSYNTLQFDAKVDGSVQNGYSIRLKNGANYLVLYGFIPGTPGYTTTKVDISGMPRDQITEIVIYVNRTSQNASQVVKIDNLIVDTASAGVPTTRLIDDFTSSDITAWNHPDLSPPYGTTVTWETGTLKVQQYAPHSANALVRRRLQLNENWADYTTLEFDAKTVDGGIPTSSNGFSVLVSNAGNTAVLRAFRPTSSNLPFRIDISGVDRDQINEMLFYINRTSLNGGQTLILDNIKLTKNPVPAPDPLVIFENFDNSLNTNLTPTWDYNQTSAGRSVVDLTSETNLLVSKPNAGQISLISSSASAYSRGVFNYRPASSPVSAEEPTQDWQPYKSLIFEAKVISAQPVRPPLDAGYAINIVNGGAYNLDTTKTPPWDLRSIVEQSTVNFHPSDQWQTISIDISGMRREQITGFRIYINRADKWLTLDQVSGQKLLIDNMRVSTEPAAPAPPAPALVDDFENGIDTWWRYSYHTYNSVPNLPGVTSAWMQPGFESNKCLQLTEGDGHSTSAYLRKTMTADWTGYKTLIFDAMASNCLTDQGFKATIRDYAGYQFGHPFAPSNTWRTHKIDITGDIRSEVIGLLYYINGTGQNNNQQLFVDNIRLSDEPAETTVTTVGAARGMRDGDEVKITGALVTGFYAAAFTDPFYTTTKRNIFFLEDIDRPSGLPVMIGKRIVDNASALKEVAPGDKVTVTGFITTQGGQRFIYARALSIDSQGNDLPASVCMTNAAASGASAVKGAGMDNTGMIVTIVGRTTFGGPLPDGRVYYYVNDGSNVTSDNATVPGIKVYLPLNEWLENEVYVRITGFLINEYDSVNKQVIRTLWVRSFDYTSIGQ